MFNLCSIFFLLFQIFSHSFLAGDYVSPEYVNMSQKIRTNVAETLSKKYHMQTIGLTGGMMDCVNLLGISFQIHGPLSKEILRTILIDSVEEFLKQVNADEKLRPFLKNYPFTEKEIEITLFVREKKGNRLFDPDISVASAEDGKIYFNTIDKVRPRGPYKQWIEEDYQTAKTMVFQKKAIP